MRRAIAVALIVLGAIAGGAYGASGPHLKLTKATPITVRGTGFDGHERVRVTVRKPKASSTRHVTVGATGSFTATFRDFKIGRCQPFSITAVGSGGSRATLVRRPACPPM